MIGWVGGGKRAGKCVCERGGKMEGIREEKKRRKKREKEKLSITIKQGYQFSII